MYLEDDPAKYEGWADVVMAYRTDSVSELTYHTIRNIVVLEVHDGSINQVFSLENEDEMFKVYSEGCCGGIFNTDGAAFIQYLKGGGQQAVYMIDNSPYDVGMYEDDWYEFSRDDDFSREIAIQELNLFLRNRGVDIHTHPITAENTVFVTQL